MTAYKMTFDAKKNRNLFLSDSVASVQGCSLPDSLFVRRFFFFFSKFWTRKFLSASERSKGRKREREKEKGKLEVKLWQKRKTS